MANKKVTDLSTIAEVTAVDIVYIVDDPSGTPASRKVTTADLVDGGLKPYGSSGDVLTVEAGGTSIGWVASAGGADILQLQVFT